MRRKIIVTAVLFLLLFPTVAQNPKLEYKYPFYCSKDIAFVTCTLAHNILLFVYEGSPVWVTVDTGMKSYRQRLTIPNHYYEIDFEGGGLFVKIVIQSEGESTFDIDGGARMTIIPYDFDEVSFFGKGLWLSENALENYEIGILLPMTEEEFWFYTLGLENGEIWIEDEENETRYGPLAVTNVYKTRKEYEVNTMELDRAKCWYVVFTGLKGAEKFYVYGDFEDYMITVKRPKDHFYTDKIDSTYVPGGPRPPW